MNRRRRSHGGGNRDFPRTARVNELLREIIGDELERIDDPRLEWVSITGVDTNPELTTAMVFYSSLGGEESDPVVLEALAERRIRLQAAIGRQARMRRTPELHFGPDRGVREGIRVEALLREIGPLPDDDAGEAEDAQGAGDADPADGAGPSTPAVGGVAGGGAEPSDHDGGIDPTGEVRDGSPSGTAD